MRAGRRLFCGATPSSLIRKVGPFTVYRGGIRGVIEIFSGDPQHPVGKLNLLSLSYAAALSDLAALLSEELNAEARVAIFTTPEGCSFSAGMDLKELAGAQPSTTSRHDGLTTATAKFDDAQFPAMSLQHQHRMVRAFQDGISALARCRIPIIAAIDHHCIGGATSVATACDVRYATARATFSVKEAAVGLAADIGVLQRLPTIIGEGCTRELAFTCRTFEAAEARELRFVEKVCPDYASLLEHARSRAAQIAACSPLGVQNTKLILNWERERSVQTSLEYQAAINAFSLRCGDIPEAARAFAEKRAPVFTDYVVHTSGGLPHPRKP